MTKTVYLTEKSLKHLFSVAAVSGDCSIRDVAILAAAYGTGMTLSELGQLPISSILDATGSVITKSAIPASIAFDGNERALYLVSRRMIEAVDRYLDYRVCNGHGIDFTSTLYRGLLPNSPVFLTSKGRPFGMYCRTTLNGIPSYSCDSLSQLFRKLHHQAGFTRASAMSARRTFAVRLFLTGIDIQYITDLLGHDAAKATRNLIGEDIQFNGLSALLAKVI